MSVLTDFKERFARDIICAVERHKRERNLDMLWADCLRHCRNFQAARRRLERLRALERRRADHRRRADGIPPEQRF
jgi:hypothetical protein